MIDYYRLLNVSRNSSLDEIKKAYKQLIRLHHPDRIGESEGHISRLLTEAYEILSDQSKRQKYDSNSTSSTSSTSPKDIPPYRKETCSQCDGTGLYMGVSPLLKCDTCSGKGWVMKYTSQQDSQPQPGYKKTVCPYCNGTGRNITGAFVCSGCSGKGWIHKYGG